MNSEEIIDFCRNNIEKFESVISDVGPFEVKGILNSEMLLFCSVIDKLGVKRIIESGRARGQSTEVMGRFFDRSGVSIDSIEYDSNSPDIPIAEKRLKNLTGVKLHFGDSYKVIPQIISDEPTGILIDGPKGLYALKLGFELMQNYESVKCIFFHDVHKDAYNVRPILEKFFYKNNFFTDDHSFVENFEFLDQECWTRIKDFDLTKNWSPYKRDKRYMQSYSSTLGMIYRSDGLEYSQIDIALNYLKKKMQKEGNAIFNLQQKFLRKVGINVYP